MLKCKRCGEETEARNILEERFLERSGVCPVCGGQYAIINNCPICGEPNIDGNHDGLCNECVKRLDPAIDFMILDFALKNDISIRTAEDLLMEHIALFR